MASVGKTMIHAGLVVEIDDDWVYILYKAQICGLPMIDEYEDFDRGQWIALSLEDQKIVRAKEDSRLEKLNRWNARIEDDELLVDVNVLKRDFDAYPITKKENINEEDNDLWSYEINDVVDPEELFDDDDIPAGTFYQCTVSLSINLEEFDLEKSTNILEPGGFERTLVEILHISPIEVQLYSLKAPWCYLYRADLPPPPLQMGQINKNNMRKGIIARKIIQADGTIRHFLWSQSTGALPVLASKSKYKSSHDRELEVGRIYLFQTQFLRDEICAVRLLATDEFLPCEVDTTQHRHRRTDNLVAHTFFETTEQGVTMEQNHPFFGLLRLEPNDLGNQDPIEINGTNSVECKFIFCFLEREKAGGVKTPYWVPFMGHQHTDFETKQYEKNRQWW